MGADSPATFDALVARPDGEVGRWTGMAPVEDLDSVVQGVRNGSWLEGGLGFASLGGDVLAAGIDPIGTGLSWAAAWVIEQVTPLREALESVTGSPAKVAACAQTLLTIEASLNHRAEALAAASRNQRWTGRARDAYGVLSDRQIEGVLCLAKSCGTVGVLTEAVGMVVAFVRDTVRDLIADCVAQLVKAGVIALIPGAGTASAIAAATALIARYAAKIAELLRHLLRSIRNLGPFFRRVEDRIAETIEGFRRATSPAFAVDGPGTHWMMSGGGSEPPSSGRRTGSTPPPNPPDGTGDLPGAATTPADTVPDMRPPEPGDPSALPFPDGIPPWQWDTNPERVVRGEDGRIYTRANENVPKSGRFEVVDNTPDFSLLRRPVLNDEGELVPPESGKFEIGEGRILAYPLDTPPPPRSPAPPPPSDKYPANWGPYPTDGPSTVPAPPDSVPPPPQTPHTPPPHDWMDERGYPHFTGSPKVPDLGDLSTVDGYVPDPGSATPSAPTPSAPTSPAPTSPAPAPPPSSERTWPSAAGEPLTPPPDSPPPSSGPSEPPQQP